MLRLVLPKGSLEKATLELFSAADLPVSRSSDVQYKATIADPRIDQVRIPPTTGDRRVCRRGPLRHGDHGSGLGH